MHMHWLTCPAFTGLHSACFDADLCSGASTYEGTFCTSSTCPDARPGATCSSGGQCVRQQLSLQATQYSTAPEPSPILMLLIYAVSCV